MATRKMTELSLQVKAKPGELTRVLETLAGGGVNVLAFCGYNNGPEEACILVVPDNEEKAKKSLEAAGFAPKANPVVAVVGEAGKGAGAKLCARISEAGINIEYAYASTPGSGASIAIFKVADPDGAVRALKGR